MTDAQLNLLIRLLAAATLFELMVALGLGVTFSEVAGVARKGRLLGRAALANYVFVPALAVGLLLLFQSHSLEPEQFPFVAAGFLIAAVCPGAPYGPPFTRMAGGNVVIAVGLMVILAASSAFMAPLLLRLLLPLTSGNQPLQINAVQMVGTLFVSQLLPLCAGLAVRQWRPGLASRLLRPANRLSLVLNLATLGVVLVAQFQMLIGIPVKAFVGMLVLVLGSVALGWLLGEKGSRNRKTLAVTTSVRNVGVSLVLATASFPGTKAVTAAMAFAVFQTMVMAVVSLLWGRLTSPPPTEKDVQDLSTQDKHPEPWKRETNPNQSVSRRA
jgi:BASS family bile acid:Na+ symporter